MTTTPRGSPELASAQAVPETTVNEQARRTEGGAGRYPIADRVTAPPGSCTNGAQYLIIATATGAFAGKENQIAQAVGTNAANGWYYRVLTTIDEGVTAYVQDEDAEYKWSGSAWATYSGGYSDEQAQDAVGAMVDGSLTYVDATPLLQRAALTGDVTASAGSNSTTIASNAVSFAKFVAAASAGVVWASGAGNYAHNASGGGTTNFLRADGTWAAPSGTGTVTTTGSPASGNLTKFSGSSSIVNGDLSGDVTTSGTLVATIVQTNLKPTEHIQIACSDETTAITTGTAKVTFRMPYAFTVTDVRASVNTAPTGSTILIDINESGTTILSTKLMIDASEKTSTTATTPAVISDSSLADDAEMTIDFDQVGSTIAGAGVKVIIIGHRT